MPSPTKTTSETVKLKAEITLLKAELNKAIDEIKWFKEQFKLIRARQFGKKSESTEAIQFVLFDEHEADAVTETIEPIDDEREQITYERRKRKNKVGRNINTSNLPRERRVHDLSDEEKICGCGCALVCIGEDKSEQIDYVPAKVSVIEHVTPKYACKKCESIKSAQKPQSPLPKSMATANFIANVIIQKYENHIPLYRLSKILEREGIDIPDNTLGNWVMGAATILELLMDTAWQEINNVTRLQADETSVKILKPDKKGYMWAYHSLDEDNRFILFEFNLSREAAVAENRLRYFQGKLQTDGYSGYNGLRKNPYIISLGCMDHCRRKFADAIKASNANKTGVAGKIFAKINALYKIERQIKDSSNEYRHEIRNQESAPILDEIYALAKSVSAPPQSALGKALTYLKNNWTYLTEYLQHPDMPMSNILIENQIRPFALGRKNWLFVGNVKSANHSALLYSLIQTCKLNGINARQYLVAVLNRAHELRRGEIDPRSLLPQFIDKSLL